MSKKAAARNRRHALLRGTPRANRTPWILNGGARSSAAGNLHRTLLLLLLLRCSPSPSVTTPSAGLATLTKSNLCLVYGNPFPPTDTFLPSRKKKNPDTFLPSTASLARYTCSLCCRPTAPLPTLSSLPPFSFCSFYSIYFPFVMSANRERVLTPTACASPNSNTDAASPAL